MIVSIFISAHQYNIVKYGRCFRKVCTQSCSLFLVLFMELTGHSPHHKSLCECHRLNKCSHITGLI